MKIVRDTMATIRSQTRRDIVNILEQNTIEHHITERYNY